MRGMQPSDSQLGRALARGDRDASDALLESYWPRAFGLALRLTGRRADAEDAVQDAFTEVWRHRARFDAERAFRPWLFRIVSRCALSRARSERRRRAREERSALGEALEPALDERLEVQELLLGLEPDLRAAVALKVMEGFTFRELAEALEIPEGTAASRVRRGLERLRRRDIERSPAAFAPLLALVPDELPARPAWGGAARRGGVGALALFAALVVGGLGVALVTGGADAQPGSGGGGVGAPAAGAATPAAVDSAGAAPAGPEAANLAQYTGARNEPTAAPESSPAGTAAAPARRVLLVDRVTGLPLPGRDVQVTQLLDGRSRGPRVSMSTGSAGELDVSADADCDVITVELHGSTTAACRLPPPGGEAILYWTPPSSFSITVVDVEGRPVAGARVRLEREEPLSTDPIDQAMFLACGYSDVRTGPDGRVAITVEPGGYRVSALAGLSFAQSEPVQVAPDGPRRLRLQLRPLEGAGILRIRVRPRPDEFRVSFAPLRRPRDGGGVSAVEDPLVLYLRAGRYAFELTGRGQRTQRWTQTVVAGEILDVTREGEPGPPLAGRVVLPTAARVRLQVSGGEEATVQRDGSFSCGPVAGEDVTLHLSAPGYTDRSFAVRAGAGDVVLDYGPVTTFACGAGLGGASAVVSGPWGSASGVLDAGGRLRVPELPLGSVARFELSDPQVHLANGPRVAEVSVTAHNPLQVQLPPEPTESRLSLQVLDAAGEPLVGGAKVIARGPRGSLEVPTNSRGAWSERVTCDRVLLAVERPDRGLWVQWVDIEAPTTHIEVQLGRGTHLRGEVATGIPERDLYVTLAPKTVNMSPGDAVRGSEVLSDGSFDLGRVGHGEWEVGVLHTGEGERRVLATQSIVLRPGPEERSVAFTLGR